MAKSNTKKFLTVVVIIVFLLLAASIGYRIYLHNKYVVPIIMYHSIDNPHHFSGIVVSPDHFRKQIKYLKKHRYNVISLDRLVTAIKEKKSLPKNSVVITFDDGYEDNYTNAFSILKEYNFPATIFVIVNLVGHEGYVTWEQLREMGKYGITTGSHTLDHVHLPGVPLEWQSHQIKDSKKIIEEKLGHKIDYLAYPSGGFSDGTKDIVEEAGYKGACTTNRGNKRFNEDVYELKRIRFKDKDTGLVMWMKLSGYYNLFRVLKEPN